MKYKMVAIDLDGTFVIKKDKISTENIKAIRKLLENNVKVIISTGRGLAGIKNIAYKLNIDKYELPVIGFNGGLVYNLNSQEALMENTISDQEMAYFFDIANKLGIRAWAYAVNKPSRAYVNKRGGLFYAWLRIRTHRKPMMYKEEKINDEAYKFIVMGTKEKLNELKEKLQEKYNFTYYDWSYNPKFAGLEISPPNTNKKNGLEFVANLYGIKQEEIVAFGDGSNDLEMLRWAGHGVAMENAKDHIKSAADHITHHYKDDGVAKAIKDLFSEIFA